MSLVTITKTYIDTRTLCDKDIKRLPITLGGVDFFPELGVEYDTENASISGLTFNLRHGDSMPEYHYVYPKENFTRLREHWGQYLSSAGIVLSKNLKQQLSVRDMKQLYDSLLFLAEDAAILQETADKLRNVSR